MLHDWDGKADHVNDDIIPVDVLDYLTTQRGGEPPDAAALAILLDYYFFHLLALLSLRIWDDGDADANLDRLDALLGRAAGADGSGQRFVDDAETLILIATSHFEIVERGYGALLERVRTLNRRTRRRSRSATPPAWAAICGSGSKPPTAATPSSCATTTSPTTRGSASRW